jgi:amino acid permease
VCFFHPVVQPDILVNYPRSAFVSIVRVAVCLLVVFSYPLQSHPARRCILTMYIALRHGKGSRIAPTTVEFYAVTALFLTASFITAMSVTNLGSVLELVGATGSTAVSYILPGAIYWRLHPNAHPLRYIAAIQLAVGCCIVPIALTFIFL